MREMKWIEGARSVRRDGRRGRGSDGLAIV